MKIKTVESEWESYQTSVLLPAGLDSPSQTRELRRAFYAGVRAGTSLYGIRPGVDTIVMIEGELKRFKDDVLRGAM